jgi:predicted Rossmann fold nucleotide-binding protein DprA/Smf involved in DNA uptake
MIEAIRKLEKPKVKAAKAKPVKKVAAKKTPVKKVVVKKPAAKKTTKTAIDSVFGFIKRYKKGVNTATLMKKTGFSEKQIQNNVYKLKKQGKIKSVGRGLYLQT